jgi:hypothetical protein
VRLRSPLRPAVPWGRRGGSRALEWDSAFPRVPGIRGEGQKNQPVFPEPLNWNAMARRESVTVRRQCWSKSAQVFVVGALRSSISRAGR